MIRTLSKETEKAYLAPLALQLSLTQLKDLPTALRRPFTARDGSCPAPCKSDLSIIAVSFVNFKDFHKAFRVGLWFCRIGWAAFQLMKLQHYLATHLSRITTGKSAVQKKTLTKKKFKKTELIENLSLWWFACHIEVRKNLSWEIWAVPLVMIG